MALQSNTTIFISEFEITAFKKITLQQNIDAHHTLDLECRMDVLEDLSLTLGESSKHFLGETITLQTQSLDDFGGYKSLEFKGIVTRVKTVKGHESGEGGDSIIIKAQSPTFISDDGPHYASYNDVTLSEIIEKTFQEYDKSKLELLIKPKNNSALHYCVQHKESSFQFASRLAAQYGEWFYYNGSKLVFGTPETNELELNYGFDLKEYHLDLMPLSHNYKYFSNDYLLNETHEKDTKDITSSTNGYNGFVANKAKTIFNKETKVWHNLYNDSKAKSRLDLNIENQKKAIQIKQVELQGVSDNPGVLLGGIVKIEGAIYRVTSILHTNNENGDYQNTFSAITAESDAYPNTNIEAFPKSETQTAIVVENADPEGLGRIKVQFPWQKAIGETTPWIRIVTPHAGADKGFHFIPETEEEVLIGFEGGNAEHPFMLGSLYNGAKKPKSWQTNQNDIKAIRTRSGHTFELNDSKGKESITITDKNGNIITIDTANNNITISALENMTLNSKNMQINVKENLDVSIGKDKTERINNNYTLTSNNAFEQVKKDKTVHAGANYNQTSSQAKLIASKGDMTIHGAGVATFQGNADVKISKG